MKQQKKKALFQTITIAFILIFGIIPLLSQCNKHRQHKHDTHIEDTGRTKQTIDSTIIRTGVIDLLSIDKNKDGFVYQDEMHWNVISDEEGTCPFPECQMPLKKVTIEEAKNNLLENGFKVKK
ncbi:MAG: hypothetical protein ACPLX7_08155 [Candidatus Kapaibacteriota bacterium]